MAHNTRIPNTFGISVCAREYIEYTSVEQLKQLLQQYRGQQILPIGAGSNLLFTKDFDGIVFHSRICSARALQEDDRGVDIEVGAGVVLDDLIAQVVDMGLYGMENLSHIPGEVGASAIQNVGAYGVEAKDIIKEVHAIAIATGEPRVFTNEECHYGYRESIFKNELQGQYIVTHVVYHLSKEPTPCLEYGNLKAALGTAECTPSAIRETIIHIRKQKLPDPEDLGSAGSFFKNPVVSEEQFAAILLAEGKQETDIPHYRTAQGVKIPAAWLIEQCGWKGKAMGGAQVYEKQPLVIVNTGTATPDDIVRLADSIIQSIRNRFGITLSPEVNYI